ncbi:MAG: serine/threonine protein kinase, partial [Pirellulales bacterium]|nr:serine/threonine protein kinase [Pirellulales bacterium]
MFNRPPCDQTKLEAFLAGRLPDQAEKELESHLDQCRFCRQQLESRAADPVVWAEASDLLTGEALETLDAPEASYGSEADHLIRTLDPTDDPHMLGRLGGYEVSGVIGSGGMGIVLKAVERSLDRVVAIKVLSPHLASSGAARKRFAREAKAAAAIVHPNVIPIHRVSNDAQRPYLVMAYVRGRSLQRRLDQEGPLETEEILRIGIQIAAGLSAAHAQGLVHRDIKPANILLDEGTERVTITDFGLARTVDDATMTRSGVIAGTPQYMSPEQAQGNPVDVRSDLFSLGSVMYAMCVGHSPFRAETPFGVLRRITDQTPRPIRELNSQIPDWLCRLIGLLHCKHPDQRYASATRVGEDLAACLAHLQTPDSPLPSHLKSAHSGGTSLVAATIPLLALLMITGGVALWKDDGVTTTRPTTPNGTETNSATSPQRRPADRSPASTAATIAEPTRPGPEFRWDDGSERLLNDIRQRLDQVLQTSEQAF